MTWEAWLTLAVVIGMVVALARDLVAPALAVLGANILLLVSGVITTPQAFSGFSNPAPITVAALFVVAAAVEKSGALQPLIAATLGNGDGGRRDLLRLLLPTAGASALLNNTPIVAMLVPQVADWAEKRGKPVSWYLMPLSFATILGGTLTVIGTSTNLVVSGLMVEAGMPAMGMFEIGRLGLPLALVGLGVIVLLAPRVLPDRTPARRVLQEELREFVVQCLVAPRGPMDGQTVEAAGLRHLQGVFLVEIERGDQLIAPVAPTTVLRGGDRLSFAGRVDTVRDLQNMRGLVSAEHRHAVEFNAPEHTFFEAVVSGASQLVGKTLREAEFRSRYQAAVLAIHRAGQRVNAKLGAVPLKEGDTLLLLADPGFRERWRHRNEFLLVSRLGGSPPAGTRQALFVGLMTLAIVGLAALGLVPILHASLAGAVLLVLARVLTPSEARNSINLDVIVLIAAAFGIGAAIETTGLASMLGGGIVESLGGMGPLAVLLAVALATLVLTELITNNAAAVLVFPIAMAAAAHTDSNPRSFAMAITVAASASFLTPIGYQTNTMVYGPGGYRFGDYARLGLPITCLVLLSILLLVPIFWPLQSGVQ
jgi:di/tricarboxylate transporter